MRATLLHFSFMPHENQFQRIGRLRHYAIEFDPDTEAIGSIENEHRTRQAIRGIRQIFRNEGLIYPHGGV
jgi:hypothetical protein